MRCGRKDDIGDRRHHLHDFLSTCEHTGVVVIPSPHSIQPHLSNVLSSLYHFLCQTVTHLNRLELLVEKITQEVVSSTAEKCIPSASLPSHVFSGVWIIQDLNKSGAATWSCIVMIIWHHLKNPTSGVIHLLQTLLSLSLSRDCRRS